MSEHPILFSAPMVRAILEGRKTVTRRVVTRSNSTVDGRGASADFWDQLGFDSGAFVDSSFGASWWRYLHVPSTAKKYDGAVHRVRSRIEPSDHLWVRETWRTGVSLDKHNTKQIDESAREAGYSRGWGPVQYEADGVRVDWGTIGDFGGEPGRIRQSIYMPRWASRITLAVKSVRVERLQRIDGDDVVREGIVADTRDCRVEVLPRMRRDHFAELWDSINGKRPGCSWEADPWVWRIEFTRVHDCCWPHKSDSTVHHSQCPNATAADRSAVAP